MVIYAVQQQHISQSDQKAYPLPHYGQFCLIAKFPLILQSWIYQVGNIFKTVSWVPMVVSYMLKVDLLVIIFWVVIILIRPITFIGAFLILVWCLAHPVKEPKALR